MVEKLKRIKAVAMDVDGVMTDCKLWMDASGEWRRSFCIRDGIGIKRLIKAGYTVGFITGTRSQDIQARVKVLGVPFLADGIEDKEDSFLAFAKHAGCSIEEVAYIGDDLPDIPLLVDAGFSATVPAAVEEVLGVVDYVTKREGGEGAVRELCDLIFKHGHFSESAPAKNKFQQG
jgi:3-deoxy-D-manno-octulosonate 8-phosphate phosphatase (KDO 8-P phosphatase)